MNINFSKHALAQMSLRHISLTDAINVLESPDQIIEEEGKKIFQSVFLENNKPYLIRIFVNIQKIPNLVITVYKTSKIDKYYEG